MSPSNIEPKYNLKAVVQETGIKPDTLRAWERRYDLPKPQRTPSGHRLYSDRDIKVLKWLLARQQEGLNIGRAVAMWYSLEEAGEDPLNDEADRIIAAGSPIAPEAPVLTVATSPSDRSVAMREQWVEACMAFDEQRAEQVLDQSFSLFSPEAVCIEVLQRGLSEIGHRWTKGEATAQQEHFASSLALRRIQALLSVTPPPTRPGRILVGCPPLEEHTFIPLLLTLLLRRHGWNVVYLGANIPVQNLEATISRANPTLVILIAQQFHTAANLLQMAKVVYDRRIPLAYGGQIFSERPEIQSCIPGYPLGNQFEDALQIVQQIMDMPRTKAPKEQPSPVYSYTLRAFHQHRLQIETTIAQKMKDVGVSDYDFTSVNAALAQLIIAGLTLCTPARALDNLEWLENLLVRHHQLPDDYLASYILFYRDSVEQNMGTEGEILVGWFNGVVSETELTSVEKSALYHTLG